MLSSIQVGVSGQYLFYYHLWSLTLIYLHVVQSLCSLCLNAFNSGVEELLDCREIGKFFSSFSSEFLPFIAHEKMRWASALISGGSGGCRKWHFPRLSLILCLVLLCWVIVQCFLIADPLPISDGYFWNMVTVSDSTETQCQAKKIGACCCPSIILVSHNLAHSPVPVGYHYTSFLFRKIRVNSSKKTFVRWGWISLLVPESLSTSSLLFQVSGF